VNESHKMSNDELWCECCNECAAVTSQGGLAVCEACATGEEESGPPSSGGWPVEVPTGLMLNDEDEEDGDPPLFV